VRRERRFAERDPARGEPSRLVLVVEGVEFCALTLVEVERELPDGVRRATEGPGVERAGGDRPQLLDRSRDVDSSGGRCLTRYRLTANPYIIAA
jgi:hypothetical protein